MQAPVSEHPVAAIARHLADTVTLYGCGAGPRRFHTVILPLFAIGWAMDAFRGDATR